LQDGERKSGIYFILQACRRTLGVDSGLHTTNALGIFTLTPRYVFVDIPLHSQSCGNLFFASPAGNLPHIYFHLASHFLLLLYTFGLYFVLFFGNQPLQLATIFFALAHCSTLRIARIGSTIQ
jgi:hypothetical protein